MFHLTAERACCDPIALTSNERATEAEAMLFFEGFVAGMGDASWPCGYDAVMRSPDGRAWVLADEWEQFQ